MAKDRTSMRQVFVTTTQQRALENYSAQSLKKLYQNALETHQPRKFTVEIDIREPPSKRDTNEFLEDTARLFRESIAEYLRCTYDEWTTKYTRMFPLLRALVLYYDEAPSLWQALESSISKWGRGLSNDLVEIDDIGVLLAQFARCVGIVHKRLRQLHDHIYPFDAIVRSEYQEKTGLERLWAVFLKSFDQNEIIYSKVSKGFLTMVCHYNSDRSFDWDFLYPVYEALRKTNHLEDFAQLCVDTLPYYIRDSLPVNNAHQWIDAMHVWKAEELLKWRAITRSDQWALDITKSMEHLMLVDGVNRYGSLVLEWLKYEPNTFEEFERLVATQSDPRENFYLACQTTLLDYAVLIDSYDLTPLEKGTAYCELARTTRENDTWISDFGEHWSFVSRRIERFLEYLAEVVALEISSDKNLGSLAIVIELMKACVCSNGEESDFSSRLTERIRELTWPPTPKVQLQMKKARTIIIVLEQILGTRMFTFLPEFYIRDWTSSSEFAKELSVHPYVFSALNWPGASAFYQDEQLKEFETAYQSIFPHRKISWDASSSYVECEIDGNKCLLTMAQKELVMRISQGPSQSLTIKELEGLDQWNVVKHEFQGMGPEDSITIDLSYTNI